jgi:hydrogenase nickel incorporation protein HypA/HybF
VHERSLVKRLLEQAREIADANGGGRIEEIRIRLGPMSGVEPLLVTTAFDDLAATAKFTTAKLLVEYVELEARCRSCTALFGPVDFVFVCPMCGAPDTEITRGGDVILESICLSHPGDVCDACDK